MWCSVLTDWCFTSKHLVPVQFKTKDINECKDLTYSPWLYLCHRSTTQFAAKLQLLFNSGIVGELPCQHYGA